MDFEQEADWHENHQCVKAAFDVEVNSARATYEIQYGTVERPTHRNTSWDSAKFEVCGHRFADLSEGNYGVTLLNDCKYGYDIHDGLMTLTLLRAPTYPDPEADRGITACTYSLAPHKGAMDAVRVYALAYDLNNPMTVLPAAGEKDSIPAAFCTVASDAPNVLCEAVKQAEDGADTVYRFFECSNTATTATLRFGYPVKSVMLCDMSENDLQELTVRDNAVALDFRAFEIQTLRVKPLQ